MLTTQPLDKLPPQSLDMEQAALGSMLIEREALARVTDTLLPSHFYKRESHGVIYEAILQLYERDEPVDVLTVTEQLTRMGQLDAVGGITYLTELINQVSTAANIDHYAKVVREKAILRELITAGTEIAGLGYAESADVEFALDKAEEKIFHISQKKTSQDFLPIHGILNDTFTRIEELYSRKSHVTGLPTGFRDLDKVTAGWQKADLIVIAARPSMGKTALALSIAEHAAIKEKKIVGVFSLEMSKEQLTQRMLCSQAMIDSQRLRTGHLVDQDWPKITRALSVMHEAPIYIDDSPGLSAMEMRSKARRLKQKHGLDLLIVDYLQLIRGASFRQENRNQEMSEISRCLKALAKELNIPVVTLSQLSREVEKRMDKRPQLSDLRDSGAIEQDADVVAFIYRDAYYHPNTDKPNIAEIIVAKQRNGPTDTVELVFLKSFTKFADQETRPGA